MIAPRPTPDAIRDRRVDLADLIVVACELSPGRLRKVLETAETYRALDRKDAWNQRHASGKRRSAR